MADRFRALPVGRGDCFILDTAGNTVMVDGGQARLGIESTLRAADVRSLDVVVCTHADSDHANGVLGVLAHSAIDVGEVWLPGQWTTRLEDLIQRPDEFAEELWDDIAADELEDSSLEEYANSISDGSGDDEGHLSRKGANAGDSLVFESDGPTSPLAGRFPWHPLNSKLLWECLSVAERIKRITLAAHDRGCRVRWFDFELFRSQNKPEGGELFLGPVNAVELAAPTPRKPNALRFLALSLANKRSLVFSSPADGARSDVLFCADSNLAFELPALSEDLLFTAPHHGSEANAGAYARVKHLSGRVVVRSDANYSQRPGNTYRCEPRAYCTICPGARALKKEAVTLEAENGVWRAVSSRGCACRVDAIR